MKQNMELDLGSEKEVQSLELQSESKKSSTLKTVSITVAVTCLLIVGGYLIWTKYLFPTSFDPVTLSDREAKELGQKLQAVNLQDLRVTEGQNRLQPEPYSESEDARRVEFSEREVNAILAHNTDLADKLAIDFSRDLASATWLVPLDPEFPMLGGKTLKLTAGLELAYTADRPVVKLRGVSLWGVPLPDAWLGYNKNIDLVKEFGSSGGFWRAFADGIQYLAVEEGKLVIQLNK